MFKRIYVHPEMVMLCLSLNAIRTSELHYGVNYRFMDMYFTKLQKGAGKHRPNVAKKMFGLKLDEDDKRQYDFASKQELVTFIENRTRHLMKDLQDKELPENGGDIK